MRTPATRFGTWWCGKRPTGLCFEYGDISELGQLLEEVSKLSEAYSPAILNSDF